MAVEQVPVEPKGGAESPEPEVDYRAKYEEMRGHAREWEKKARANESAAAELEKLKASQMSDMERIQKQYEDEKRRADGLQAEKDRAAWVARVSGETGVPSDLLSLIEASSEEELSEKAAGLAERYGSQRPKPQTVPVVLGDGRHADPEEPAGDFIREQFMKMRSH